MEGSVIKFTLLCVYILTSASDDSLSKRCFCEPPFGSGCDFSTKPNPNNWRKENVALGRSVRVSSSQGEYRTNIEKEMQGCMAANGNTTNVYVSRSNNNIDATPNCFRSDPSDPAPSWEVDLVKNYTISEVTIHLESMLVGIILTRTVVITVDDKECGKIFNITRTPAITINCQPIVRGSRVKLQLFKPAGASDQLRLCEVQVWACQDKYFLEDCGKMCTEGCKGCDNLIGFCWEKCFDGYYNVFCDKICGACEEKRCDLLVGVCLSKRCQDGWRGVMCDKACAHGYFGANCSSKCPNCPQGTSCNRFNGSCIVGCGEGFTGPDCKEPCGNNSWGPNCKSKCGNCLRGMTCDPIRGHCPKGCEIGWKPPMCTTLCDKKSYGFGCRYLCGHCKLKGPCDVKYGTCPDGCDEGWTTDLCNEACKPGLYGSSCKYKCGHCSGSLCDRFSGKCTTGCQDGWLSVSCNEPCAPGTWGKDCNLTCGSCESGLCDNTDGKCERCATGFQGALCNEKSVQSLDDYYPIVTTHGALTTGIVIAGVCVMAVVVGVYLIVIRNKGPRSLSGPGQQQTTLVSPLPSSNTVKTNIEKNEDPSVPMQTEVVLPQNEEAKANLEEISISESLAVTLQTDAVVPQKEDTKGNLEDVYFSTRQENPIDDEIKELKTNDKQPKEESGNYVAAKKFQEGKKHKTADNERRDGDDSSEFGREEETSAWN